MLIINIGGVSSLGDREGLFCVAVFIYLFSLSGLGILSVMVDLNLG